MGVRRGPLSVQKSDSLQLSAAQQERWLVVLEALMNGDPDEGVTVDELARLPVFKRIESEQAAWDSGEAATPSTGTAIERSSGQCRRVEVVW